MCTSKALLSVLKPPQKLASVLETRGPLLSLDIRRHSIHLALATHPGVISERLETLPVLGRRISRNTTRELSAIVQEHGVCGFVVAWPLQASNGKMGAPCGRVLYTLEEIFKHSLENSHRLELLSSIRPACLWGNLQSMSPQFLRVGHEIEDEWGRCASHGRPSDKSIHLASEEQYFVDDNDGKRMEVLQMWNTFSHSHWPELSNRQEEQRKRTSRRIGGCNLVSDWQDRYSCHRTAAAAS